MIINIPQMIIQYLSLLEQFITDHNNTVNKIFSFGI